MERDPRKDPRAGDRLRTIAPDGYTAELRVEVVNGDGEGATLVASRQVVLPDVRRGYGYPWIGTIKEWRESWSAVVVEILGDKDARDPRVDPKAGDVFELGASVFIVLRVAADGWCWVLPYKGTHDPFYYQTLVPRETFATAAVLRVAP